MSTGSQAGFQPPTQTQQVTFPIQTPGVGMTTEHYEWAKTRIRNEVKEGHTSSIWLALAIGVGGVGATLWATLDSATLSAVTYGQMEVAAIACGVVTALLVVVHFVFWRRSSRRADELIRDLDLHTMPVVVQPSEARVSETQQAMAASSARRRLREFAEQTRQQAPPGPGQTKTE